MTTVITRNINRRKRYWNRTGWTDRKQGATFYPNAEAQEVLDRMRKAGVTAHMEVHPEPRNT